MARAHLYLPVSSAAGDVIAGASVRLLNPGTTTLISDTVYSAASSSGAYTQPFTVSTGVVDVYLTNPRRVRLGITPPGQAEFFLDDVDIAPDAGLVVTAPATLRITNSPASAGDKLVAIDATTAHWVAGP